MALQLHRPAPRDYLSVRDLFERYRDVACRLGILAALFARVEVQVVEDLENLSLKQRPDETV